VTARRTNYPATMARVAAVIEAKGIIDYLDVLAVLGADRPHRKASNWIAHVLRFGWLVRLPRRHGQPRARYQLGPCDSWRRDEIPDVRGPRDPGFDELLLRAVHACAYAVQVRTTRCRKVDRPHREVAKRGAIELAAELFGQVLELQPDLVVQRQLVGGAA
jgi:hypothetical protein